MVLPLASGHCNVYIFLVPGEEAGESQAAVMLHGTGQQVKLRPTGAHKSVGTADIDEEPLLEKVLGVIGEQRPLADELHPALNLKFWLSHGQTTTGQLSNHS